MTFSELKKLVAQGEGRRLEFKKKADHPEKIVRELVAFANSGGGILLLGVEDDGQIPGLRFPDEQAYVMESAIALYSKPNLEIKVERIKILMGHEVLLYRVAEGHTKPYLWLADKEQQMFRAYVRSKDQTLQASKEMFQILKFIPNPDRQKPFQITPLAKLLFQYLSQNESITISNFSKLAEMPRKKVSAYFVGLVKQGVLKIEPKEMEDLYCLEAGYKEY